MAPLGRLFDIVRDYFYSILIHDNSFSVCRSNTKHFHHHTCSYFDECRLEENNKKHAQVPTDLAWIVIFCIAGLVFTFLDYCAKGVIVKGIIKLYSVKGLC